MLSGVGPSNHLKEKGIEVIHDSKGVGKNLQDHLRAIFNKNVKLQIHYIHM